MWLFCSGGTPIHHLACGNPGTPFRHAQTERLPNLCLITQQVCGEVRTYMVSHPQWVEVKAQPCVTNIGPGCCEQLHIRASWRPWCTLALQHEPDFPAPAAGLPNHSAMWVPVPVSCLMGTAERDGQLHLTSQPVMSTDRGERGMWAPKPGSVMSLTCHSNF